MRRVRLPAALDVTAEAVIDEMRVVDSSDELVIDAGDVSRVDAAGMQLAYAVVHAARGRVSWCATSPAFVDAARMLGLAHHLRLEG
jgi:anti-anti-sigma regulatory factor